MKRYKRPLRVGFDLDGVLLYNPARIVRPIISWVKRTFLHKRKLSFYYPKTHAEKIMWKLFHYSSIYNAPGLDEIRRLVKEGKIEAYLITARFGFLGNSVLRWVKYNNLTNTFKEVYYNKNDEQPHLFKERMINKLKLDAYIEDNFDIVTHISKTTPAHIMWIYNILDRSALFPHKFPHLDHALKHMVSFHKLDTPSHTKP